MSDPTPSEIETLAEAMHVAYLDAAKGLGWSIGMDVPYAALSEDAKELNRVIARTAFRVVRAVAPAGAGPSEAAIDAVCEVAMRQAMDMIASDRLTPDGPEYREVVRERLRIAYAVDFGAAAPRDARP